MSVSLADEKQHSVWMDWKDKADCCRMTLDGYALLWSLESDSLKLLESLCLTE